MDNIGQMAAAGVNVAGTLAVTGAASNIISKQSKRFAKQGKVGKNVVTNQQPKKKVFGGHASKGMAKKAYPGHKKTKVGAVFASPMSNKSIF